MPRQIARALPSVAVAAWLGCAGAEPSPPAGPPAFEGARSVVLVRHRAWKEERRPRDALDALAESLGGQGMAVRIVEIGPAAPPASLDLQRLHAWTESRASAVSQRVPGGVEFLGRQAGKEVQRLGAEVVVFLHLFEEPLLPPLPDPLRPFDPFLRQERAFSGPPLGALALVDREGNGLVLAWGAHGSEHAPSALVNAAEAVEAALRVLSGPPHED